MATLEQLVRVHSRRAEAVLIYLTALKASFGWSVPKKPGRFPADQCLARILITPYVDRDGIHVWEDNPFRTPSAVTAEPALVLREILKPLTADNKSKSKNRIIFIHGAEGTGKSVLLQMTAVAIADFLAEELINHRLLVDEIPIPVYFAYSDATSSQSEKRFVAESIHSILEDVKAQLPGWEENCPHWLKPEQFTLLKQLQTDTYLSWIAQTAARSRSVNLIDDVSATGRISHLVSSPLTFVASKEELTPGHFGDGHSLDFCEYRTCRWNRTSFSNFVGRCFAGRSPDDRNAEVGAAERHIGDLPDRTISVLQAAEYVRDRLQNTAPPQRPELPPEVSNTPRRGSKLGWMAALGIVVAGVCGLIFHFLTNNLPKDKKPIAATIAQNRSETETGDVATPEKLVLTPSNLPKQIVPPLTVPNPTPIPNESAKRTATRSGNEFHSKPEGWWVWKRLAPGREIESETVSDAEQELLKLLGDKEILVPLDEGVPSEAELVVASQDANPSGLSGQISFSDQAAGEPFPFDVDRGEHRYGTIGKKKFGATRIDMAFGSNEPCRPFTLLVKRADGNGGQRLQIRKIVGRIAKERSIVFGEVWTDEGAHVVVKMGKIFHKLMTIRGHGQKSRKFAIDTEGVEKVGRGAEVFLWVCKNPDLNEKKETFSEDEKQNFWVYGPPLSINGEP